MTSIIVHTENLNKPAPLFLKYRDHSKAQPAFLELNTLDKSICAKVEHDPKFSMPTNFQAGVIIVPIAPNVNGVALMAFMMAESTQELARQIFNGYSVDNSGHYGHLSESAYKAWCDLKTLAEDIRQTEVCDCGKWLADQMLFFDAEGVLCSSDDAVIVEIRGFGRITPDSDPDQLTDALRSRNDVYLLNVREYCYDLIGRLIYNDEPKHCEV